MTRPTRGRRAAMILPALLLSLACGARAQARKPVPDPAAEDADRGRPPEKVAFGIRFRAMPLRKLSTMGSGVAMATTTASGTAYDWTYNTTARSSPMSGGLALEIPLRPSMFLSTELLFDPLHYTKVTDTYWGTDDPNTSTDERSHRIINEDTRARLWDLPVLVNYRVSRSRMYVLGGAVARAVTNVRTTTDTTISGTTTTSQAHAQPSKRNVFGAVAGIGWRFVDDFNIKVTPEIRYTRWLGGTFASDSTQSPRDQLEIGIGFAR